MLSFIMESSKQKAFLIKSVPHLCYNNFDYKSNRKLKIQSWELHTVTECLTPSLVIGLLGVIIRIRNYTFIMAAGFNYTL